MFIIIGIMFAGMLLGFLLRKQRLSWIHKVITVFIWLLLFLLGIDVGSNQEIINGLHTIGLEAVILTLAAVRFLLSVSVSTMIATPLGPYPSYVSFRSLRSLSHRLLS